ncbi:hypothetical protein U1Q18_010029 [Sarracenia purpurea var. burkii]
MELHAKGTSEKDSAMDYMLLQGVRFAFRIHQQCEARERVPVGSEAATSAKETTANLFGNPKSQRPSEEEDKGAPDPRPGNPRRESGQSSARGVATAPEKTRIRRFQIPSRWRFQEAAVVIPAASKAKKQRGATTVREEEFEKLPANKEESGEREAIFRRFTASAVPTSERILALCSAEEEEPKELISQTQRMSG